MDKIILLLFLFVFQFGKAQIQFDKTLHNFGELSMNTLRFVDVYLKNNADKAHYILSVKNPLEVVYIQQRALILPGESVAIRLQANPKSKGSFSYNVEIFTSDKQYPTVVKLKGNLRVVPPKRDNNFTACPSFGQSPTNGNPLDFELTIITRDVDTKAPLGKSTVELIQNGREIGVYKTNKDGEVTKQIPLGYTYFYANQDGYSPEELGTYVNFQRNYVVIDLYKNEIKNQNEDIEVEIIEEEIPIETEVVEENVIVIEETIEEEIAEEIIEEPTIEVEVTQNETSITPTLESLPEDNFSDAYFLPTNVVFVIDVSSSMRSADKLELMKYSLYQLTDMLRPQDRIGLVSYANNANVLLKPTSGKNKEEIKGIVEGMKASGLTAGGAGIKLGYKQAKKNFLTEGKNQVIIITDGGFNKNSGDYKKYIRKYKRKGITLSVVGIKNKDTAEDQMQEAAKIGDGRYVPIFGLEDAKTKLKQEIRTASFKY